MWRGTAVVAVVGEGGGVWPADNARRTTEGGGVQGLARLIIYLFVLVFSDGADDGPGILTPPTGIENA